MDTISRRRRHLLGLLPLLLIAAASGCTRPAPPSGDYLFCFWNTENFFDNKVNGWNDDTDRRFDRWFAEEPAAFEQKVKNLTEVLAALNDGKGPDILALAEIEVESTAAQTLMESLNKAIVPGTPPYRHILMKNPHGGRNIATAILTRLPVVADRTRLLGKRLRILEGHVEVEGRELIVLATHWSSRVSDKTGDRRAKYADQIYGRFRAAYTRNPDVSLLICGDFNDNPDDPSVTEHLHAKDDRERVLAGEDPPLLYNVFAPLWAEKKGGKDVGTHFYRGKGAIFDQIVVSPGMIDGKGAWQCQTDTARIVKHPDHFVVTRGPNKGHPRKFGSASDEVPLAKRGASDHLPVTVRLRLIK
jgi:endonuclease/exonuclease/phosphatase family metal-dependent hydrolase